MSLDDIHQTVTYIPHDGDEPDEDTLPSTSEIENDLENGPQLRFEAYTAAWRRCLERVKAIIAELYAPIVVDVLNSLENIHADVLPGLPFPELPVVTVADLSGGSVFLDRLSARLERDPTDGHDGEEEEQAGPPTLVNHLYPSDCLNLTSAMKNLIGGFVDRDKDAPKRRPATSLAPYDLGLLQAWYDATEDPRPALLVLLHDFEQFDKGVVQDVLYICSLQVARLPLTFLLSFSTPSPSSYLHATLARATLALLRVYHFAVPAGPAILDAIVLKTFFDPAPAADLPLLPGPALLRFVEDYYRTHSASLDTLISILQLAHLKHYTSASADPLVLLAISTPPLGLGLATHPDRERAFLEVLLGRLHVPSDIHKSTTGQWRAHARSPDILLQAVDAARDAFTRHARRTKLGVALVGAVITALRADASSVNAIASARSRRLERWTGVGFVRRVLDADGEFEEDGDGAGSGGAGVEGLAELLRKLPIAELNAVLDRLEEYCEGLPLGVAEDEVAMARRQIKVFRRSNTTGRDEIAEWVEGYLAELLQPLEDATPLWSVWYTGLTPFPSELLNPALRPAIVSGLSYPHSYITQHSTEREGGGDDEEEGLTALPDTSILFKGYMRAGRMINVYDWFDNFRVVLEGQRRAVGLTTTASVKSKGKGKGKKVEQEQKEEEDEEKWKLSVQARFMRALHELDWLGFIKHTSRGGAGRKGEYVLRTVLGVLD